MSVYVCDSFQISCRAAQQHGITVHAGQSLTPGARFDMARLCVHVVTAKMQKLSDLQLGFEMHKPAINCKQGCLTECGLLSPCVTEPLPLQVLCCMHSHHQVCLLGAASLHMALNVHPHGIWGCLVRR